MTHQVPLQQTLHSNLELKPPVEEECTSVHSFFWLSNYMKYFDEDKLVTIKVVYHMPDYLHVLNEFVWQTHDILPLFPRTHRFIDFWNREIEGPINHAEVVYVNWWGGREYKKVDHISIIQ